MIFLKYINILMSYNGVSQNKSVFLSWKLILAN